MRLVALFLGILFPLCSAPPVTVLAAASLTEAFGEMGPAFVRAHPGQAVRFGFGGSNQLRLQIQQGAPTQVFASADEIQMDILRREGRVKAIHPLATNHLALVVRKGSPVGSWLDLAKPRVRLVMTHAEVPIGAYSERLLASLGRERGVVPGFLDAVHQNVVSREANVRQLRAKLELGEADAAILYATDAVRLPPGLRVLALPDSVQPDIRFTLAALEPSGEAFVAFATSAEGKAILCKHGFR